MHRQLNERRQITLPPKLLKEIGAHPGQYFEIQKEGRRLVLILSSVENAEKKEADYDWKALDRLVHRERKKAKSFHQAHEAIDCLKKISAR